VIVDLGFTEAVGTQRGRQFLRCPSQGLAEIGIDCASVDHVIISHFHYDHVGNYALFPNATFYVQDEEMRFYTGRYLSQPAFRHSIELDDLVALVRYNYEGRLSFVDGEQEILPGIAVHKVGGHTAGMQIISVQTKAGRAVVASDASHYYHNIEKNVPFMTLHDIPGMYNGFQRIRALADKPELIIPGHDPLVLERLRSVAEGIVSLA
jgi:glyoxylase-like metal-dependent hydrolase (beta-lactamase superfamily II)